MWRLHCTDTVLDKHSDPSLSGPQSVLTFDEKYQRYFLKYFGRASEDSQDLHYITWDGNLYSSFKEIEILFNQLYILSEMGQAFNDSGGNADSSGTALKLRMVSPRIKASRISGMNTATIKKIICMLATVNGISVDYDSLTMHWNDGLPVDDTEQISNLVTATGNKAIMSKYAAMKRMGLSDIEVESELE